MATQIATVYQIDRITIGDKLVSCAAFVTISTDLDSIQIEIEEEEFAAALKRSQEE